MKKQLVINIPVNELDRILQIKMRVQYKIDFNERVIAMLNLLSELRLFKRALYLKRRDISISKVEIAVINCKISSVDYKIIWLNLRLREKPKSEYFYLPKAVHYDQQLFSN